MKIHSSPALLLAGILLASSAAATPSQPADGLRTRGLYLQLIRQARADGRARAAIAYLDDFERQFPHDRDAALLRVNSLLDLGQTDEAAAALAAVDRSGATGRDEAAIEAAQGHVLAARGDWRQAVPAYARAVKADPTAPLLRNALGYALLRSRRPEQAVETLLGAADLAPDDPIIRNNLILAYAVDGREQAVADAIAHLGDRKAQEVLREQVLAEASRISSFAAPTARPTPNKKER